MKAAIEFTSRIQDDRLFIPRENLPELKLAKDKNVRVVVFVDDYDLNYDNMYQEATRKMTGLEEAAEDVKYGRVYSAKDADDLIQQCLQ